MDPPHVKESGIDNCECRCNRYIRATHIRSVSLGLPQGLSAWLADRPPHRDHYRALLTNPQHFDDTGTMEIKSAIRSLAALAHNSRLEIFRLLVQKGPQGMAATAIAEKIGL